MPLAAPIAASLNFGLPARAFALWVGGNDWLKQPGVSGNRYGVPIDTIEVTEAGPGGVSSMRFSVEDPLNVLTLPSSGSEVLFMDIADNHPEFLGFVQSIKPRPHAGQAGRWIDVEAIGIECLLDWIVVPGLTLEASTLMGDNFQRAAAGAPLRVFLQKGGGFVNGTQALPVGNMVQGWFVIPDSSPFNLPAATLREMLRAIWNQVGDFGFGFPTPTASAQITVDFTRGLRAWFPNEGYQPDDYVTLVVNDTAFTNTSAELEYTLVPADIVRGLLIIGGSGYTGTFSDGSGIVGQQAILNDTTITSSAAGSVAALGYLGEFALQVRGRLHLNTFNHGTTKYQVGGLLTLTDAMVGLSANTFRIGAITKHYNPDGTEEWDIQFGGLAPSAMNAIRRQTRDTLS
jgi:hypothetical protein